MSDLNKDIDEVLKNLKLAKKSLSNIQKAKTKSKNTVLIEKKKKYNF